MYIFNNNLYYPFPRL